MFFSLLHDKHFETDGKFLVELMNRLPHFITIHQPLWWVYKSEWIHFLFSSLIFRRKLHLISLFFVHYNVIQLRYFCWKYFLINLILLDGLLRLVCLFMVYSYFFMIIDQQNVGTFLMTYSSATVFILFHMVHQSISSFEHLFFLFRLFYLSTRFFSVLTLFWPLNQQNVAS